MKIARALLLAASASAVATAAATGNQAICQDGTPSPTTPTPTTPTPTTPTPTTPEVTTPEPTTPEVTTPEPSTCSRLEYNTIYLTSVIGMSPRSLGDCCAACASTRGCQAFMHFSPPTNANQCLMLFGKPVKSTSLGDMVTGFVDKPKQCLIEPVGTKFLGHVPDDHTADSLDRCCGNCAVRPWCVAYNFNSRSRECQLMDTVTSTTMAAGWIAGRNPQ